MVIRSTVGVKAGALVRGVYTEVSGC